MGRSQVQNAQRRRKFSAAKRCAKIFDALLFVASLAIRLVRGPTPRTKLWAAKYTTRGYRRETNTRMPSHSAQS